MTRSKLCWLSTMTIEGHCKCTLYSITSHLYILLGLLTARYSMDHSKLTHSLKECMI